MSFGYQVLGFGSFPNRAGGYTIENAVRFAVADDTLKKTFDGAGDTQKAVISFWIKQCSAGANNKVFSDSGSDALNFLFNTDDEVRIRWTNSISTAFLSNGQFRDYTAWQHFALAIDMTQATDTNRLKLYVNGVEATVKSTSYPAQSATFTWNTAIEHVIHGAGEAEFYLAEFISLDGQSIVGGDLAITDLVDTDSNGVAVPVDPSGLTFGTNGFHLDFAVAPGTGNGSGTDASGNGNHFAETSMTAAQQVTDTCTDDAANDIGNHWTLNPLASTDTLTGGNLSFTAAANFTTYVTAPAIPMSGKWYYEVTATGGDQAIGTSASYDAYLGLVRTDVAIPTGSHDSNNNLWVIANWNPTPSGQKENGGSAGGSYAPTSGFGDGSIIMVAIDMDNNAMWFGNDNTWADSATASEIAAGTTTNAAFTNSSNNSFGSHQMMPYHAAHSDLATYNFGATAFAHTPPTGFKALNTANLPAPTVTNPSDFYKSLIWTGNGDAVVAAGNTSRALTGLDFQPDFVWIKSRSSTADHVLADSVRGGSDVQGTDIAIMPNLANAQGSGVDGGHVKTFDSDGFTVRRGDGGQSGFSAVNRTDELYVAFCLKAGGAGSSNTDGSINTTKTSVATHGGFSINTYTGTGANATVGHGLSSEPQMIITKNLTDADAWAVYHSGNTSAPETEYLVLNTNSATADLATYWNDTAPTSSVFSIGSVTNTNGSSDSMVAYCFARTPGLIGIGSYIGNANTDGPYVVVDDGASGFKPAFLMAKGASSAGSWIINDATRSPFNVVNDHILADSSAVEATSASNNYDFTANGFKVRSSNGDCNSNGNTIIYLAFAENPFGGSGVAQAKAR